MQICMSVAWITQYANHYYYQMHAIPSRRRRKKWCVCAGFFLRHIRNIGRKQIIGGTSIFRVSCDRMWHGAVAVSGQSQHIVNETKREKKYVLSSKSVGRFEWSFGRLPFGRRRLFGPVQHSVHRVPECLSVVPSCGWTASKSYVTKANYRLGNTYSYNDQAKPHTDTHHTHIFHSMRLIIIGRMEPPISLGYK